MVAGKQAVLRNGIAYAPSQAPQNVKNAIWAANKLRRKPYVWGGGHGSFNDYGYDCSGSVSYALHGGGLLGRAAAIDRSHALRRARARPMDYDLLSAGPYLCRHCRSALRYDRFGPRRRRRTTLVCGWARHARLRRAASGGLLTPDAVIPSCERAEDLATVMPRSMAGPSDALPLAKRYTTARSSLLPWSRSRSARLGIQRVPQLNF